jgi:hypothetical protein
VAGQRICPVAFNLGPDWTPADFAFVLVVGRRFGALSQTRQTRTAHHGMAGARSGQVDGGSVVTVQHTRGTSPSISKEAIGRRDDRLTTSIWMTPKQAARYLNLSVSWLAKRRLAGDGPPYVKPGGAVRYAETSLQHWMKSQ